MRVSNEEKLSKEFSRHSSSREREYSPGFQKTLPPVGF
jgi:hypothetical protein